MEEEGGESVRESLDTEKRVVKRIKEECEENRPRHLKKIFAHVNLATRKFHEIWQDWWNGPLPPRLEVDLIPVFQMEDAADEVFTAGVEVKYFKDNKRSFYEGLQQALSFGAFGFDSLVLWHIFSPELKNEEIQTFSRVVEEIVGGLRLPITYIATKITDEFKFEFFAPSRLYSSSEMDAASVLSRLRGLASKMPNPLLDKAEVERRKRTLKVVLRIP